MIKKSIGICRVCAKNVPAWYEERSDGIYFVSDCHVHGVTEEIVERDLGSFLWGYEQEYKKGASHLAIPVTYRCNLKCKYCYTMSNSSAKFPADKSLGTLKEIYDSFEGNVTLIGGEPTVRKDLFEIIRLAKEHSNVGKLSLATNGQRLKDIDYVKKLAGSGLDFVFLSYNDKEYDESIHVNNNKIKALQNCSECNIPVWLQGTFSQTRQLDSFVEAVETYKKNIFNITLRAVKPIGVREPEDMIFVSDILRYLGKEDNYKKGSSPFNRYVQLSGKRTKICSWVLDMGRLESVDSSYIIADNSMTTFHRGMILDEILLKDSISSDAV
ncbi:MAG: radical SAM protein [Sedimenticola sp.]